MLQTPSLSDIDAARDRLTGIARRTPLLPIELDGLAPAATFLKLECLQPIGSFKLRGAANVMGAAGPDALRGGVLTASAGNMAQGVAWCARTFGVRCHVVVPEHAPRAKTDAIERLGGEITRVPFERWWQTLVDGAHPGMQGVFVHPFADPLVMAGNGTVAMELLEDAQELDAVLVPYGGGGLAIGIAAALREISPRTRVYAVEVETAAPLHASLAAGAPTPVTYTRTFVDGMGSAGVFPSMWPLARSVLAGSLVVSVAEIAAAVRLLAERAHVVAEGAGAAPLAAALSPAHAETLAGLRVACIVSGGNIDSHRLATVLTGGIPE